MWTWLSAALTFACTYLVNLNVTYYGDDYYFMTLRSASVAGYLRNCWGVYAHDNGRLIVHMLAVGFLSLDLNVWRAADSLMLAGIVVLGSLLIRRYAAEAGFAAPVLLCAGILLLRVALARESVYWLTGSFNYVYPILMLLAFWAALAWRDRLGRASVILLPALGLLAGASAEQVSAMAAGLAALYAGYHVFMLRQRLPAHVWAALALAVLGAASVILSPSTFARWAVENTADISLFAQIRDNVRDYLGGEFLFAGYTLAYNLLFVAAAGAYTALRGRGARRLSAIGAPPAAGLLIYGCAAPHAVFTPALVACMACILLYMAIAAFCACRAAWRLNYARPLLAPLATLAAGSQAMMLVSPVYGPRNTLCALILLTVFSAALLAGLPEPKGAARYALPALAAALTLYGVLTAARIAGGYAANMQVARANLKVSRGEGALVQYYMIDDSYGWSWPYASAFHLPYYEMYLGLPVPDPGDPPPIEWEPYSTYAEAASRGP